MALPSSHIPLPQRLIRPILDFEDDAVVKKDLEPAPQQHVGCKHSVNPVLDINKRSNKKPCYFSENLQLDQRFVGDL